MADAMAGVAGSVPQGGLLGAGTQRPHEPVTAGLPSGPGPGPEAVGMPSQSQTGAFYRRLTMLTGNSYFAELAMRANL